MSFMSSDFFVMLNDCCKNTGFYDLCSKLLSILFDIHLKNAFMSFYFIAFA